MMPSIYLALKDMRLLARDKAALFWAFGFPLAFALLFGLAFSGGGGRPSGIRLALVDEDGTPASRQFLDSLGRADTVTTTSMSREQAVSAVRTGHAAAAIFVKKGFSGNPLNLFSSHDSPVEMAIDPAHQMESGFVQGMIMQAKFQALQQQFVDPEQAGKLVQSARDRLKRASAMPDVQRAAIEKLLEDTNNFAQMVPSASMRNARAGGISFEVPKVAISTRKEGPDSYVQISFPQSILWGLIGCMATFAASLAHEKARGTYQRLQVSPISQVQILLGKGIACFVSGIAVVSLLVTLGTLVFHMHISSFPLLALATVCLVSCFVGVMMFTSTLGRTERSVASTGWSISMIMAMFGGAMVPLVMMPPWMRNVGSFSPVKWGILAMEGVFWRHYTFAEIMGPCAILLSAGAVFALLAFWQMRRSSF
ncbi:MAG: ABC transporter permease [Candidatus Sumerlaeaceae bacterium]